MARPRSIERFDMSQLDITKKNVVEAELQASDDVEGAYIKINRADVLTAQQAGSLRDPLIKAFPPFAETLVPR